MDYHCRIKLLTDFYLLGEAWRADVDEDEDDEGYDEEDDEDADAPALVIERLTPGWAFWCAALFFSLPHSLVLWLTILQYTQNLE